MNLAISGSIAMAAFIIGLYFLKFWKTTKDRFFLFFALSFWIQALDRVVHVFTLSYFQESNPFFYLMRLLAFGLILFAVVDKNRPKPFIK